MGSTDMSRSEKKKKLLRVIRADTYQKVEIIRHIYNDNLDMLGTVPLPYRSAEDQREWWKENRDAVRAYLFEKTDSPECYVGFITLSDRGSFVTPILAVDKKYWGCGYGSEMVSAYLRLAHKPLAGSQLVSNDAIRYINKKVGWIVVGKAETPSGDIELVYHPGISRKNPGKGQIQESVIQYLLDKYKGTRSE